MASDGAGAAGLSREEVAARAGVDVGYVDELIAAGVLTADASRMSRGDVRRVGVIESLREGGLPLDGLVEGFRRGVLSLDFVDQPDYERFSTLSPETFEQVSDRTGIPLALLLAVREGTGFGTPSPEDRLREDELEVLPFLEQQVRAGFRAPSIERFVRAMGDNLRRIATAEAEWWQAEVSGPRLEAGQHASDLGSLQDLEGMSEKGERALLAIYHAQQTQTWTSNILTGFEYILAREGLYQPPDRPPAICFLDITGYTRLTQERGDRAAAQLAETLARIVKRTSLEHGGRPVKWLGDGVMFWFRDPGAGVAAALRMVDEIRDAGLPPAHVGLHAGPVVVQDGDYFGQTVNMASRIAEYARPGEVLVSSEVVDQAGDAGVQFSDIGAVELKGVTGVVQLHAARLA